MDLIEQYHPQSQPDSPLHRLQLRRIEARREADKSRERLKSHLHELVAPDNDTRPRSFLGNVIANAGAIVSGVQFGWRILAALRRYK